MHQVNFNLNKNNTLTDLNTNDSLKTHWHKIQTSIISATLKIIPNKKLNFKNFHYTHSQNAIQLYQTLKLTGQIIWQVKYTFNNNLPILPNIPLLINKINQQQQLNIDSLPINNNGILIWLTNTQTHWKTLHKAREAENSIHIWQQINIATEKDVWLFKHNHKND